VIFRAYSKFFYAPSIEKQMPDRQTAQWQFFDKKFVFKVKVTPKVKVKVTAAFPAHTLSMPGQV
jgi:hypothetical protein